MLLRRRRSTPQAAAPDEEIPRYPPFLEGIPATPVARVLDTQAALIERLRQATCLTTADFERLVLPVVSRYAGFVHLLPASETHHHRLAGGLFRHGLEVALLAAQSAQGRLFGYGLPPEQRHRLEPCWQLAALLAGLCHDLGKPVTDLRVTSRQGGYTWNPALEPLDTWASRNQVDRYFLHWRSNRWGRHELCALLVLHRVLSDECLAFLANADSQIVHALAATLAGVEQEGPLADLVYAADRDSVERDLRTFGNLLSQVGLGVPLEQYLIDAMRRLLRGGQWTVNQPGARVWVLPEGVHLVWRAAAGEIIDLLSTEQVAGIPRDPDTLADILVERGLAVPRPLTDGASFRYWLMTPLSLDHPARLYTLRLADPTVLFSNGIVPPSVQARFLDADSTATPQETGIDTGDDRPVWLKAAPPLAEASPTTPWSLDSASPHPYTEVSTASPALTDSDDVAPVKPLPPASPATTALPFSPDSEQARHWLHQQGRAGNYLLQVIARLRTHRDYVLPCGEQWALLYPESLAELDLPPVQVLTLLADAQWLELDPLLPAQRRVRDIDTPAGPRKGLVLTPPVAACVQALVGTVATAPVTAQPVPARPTTTEPAPPTGAIRELLAYFWREQNQLPFAVQVRDQRLYLPYREALSHYAARAGVSFSKLVTLVQQAPAAALTTQRQEQGLLLVISSPDRL